MNKLLASASALALTVAFTAAAQAEQDATLDQNVDNTVSVDGGQKRSNDLSTSGSNASGVFHVQENNGSNNTIGVEANIAVGGEVDQDAFVFQSVTNNKASEVAVKDVQRDNQINDSFNGASGRIAVQQNNGDANAIGANFAIMVDLEDDTSEANQRVVLFQEVFDNELFHVDEQEVDTRDRNNNINPSFNGANGVITVQQNNGNGNAMGVNNAVATAETSDIETDQYVNVYGDTAENFVLFSDIATERDNTVLNSFNRSQGIRTVQQNNGDANVIGAANAVFKNDIDENDNDVEQDVFVAGYADNHVLLAVEGDRDNDVTGSFNNSGGIVTVQQNNGTGNAIGSANAVAINVGEDDSQIFFGEQQRVDVTGETSSFLSGALLLDFNNERTNTIDGSFNTTGGLITVQQNNGDQNAIGAAHAVAVAGENDTNNGAFDDDLDQQVSVYGDVVKTLTFDDDERVGGGGEPVTDIIGQRQNDINSSFRSAKGVVSVQQNNGNGNVIGTGVAVRADLEGPDTDSDLEQIETEIFAGGSVIMAASDDSSNSQLPRNGLYDNRNGITGSFTNAEGVATVQQNNGDANVMSQAVGVSANLFSDDDIDEADSASAKTEGFVHVVGAGDGFLDPTLDGSNRLNSIDGSFNGAKGVLDVQQNNGDHNVISDATSVIASVDTDQQAAGEVDNEATADGAVIFVASFADAVVDRGNEIKNSFNGAKGVGTVQQNNGNNNVVNSSTSVVASIDSGDFGPTVSNTALAGTVSYALSIVEPTLGVDPGAGNLISGSFNNAAGVMTVQQNNGNNNVVQSVIAVSANVNGVFQ